MHAVQGIPILGQALNPVILKAFFNLGEVETRLRVPLNSMRLNINSYPTITTILKVRLVTGNH